MVFAQCPKRESPASIVIIKIVKWLAYLTVAWTILLFVFAGYKFIKSEGDVGEVMRVKNIIVASLLGVTIAWTADTIVRIITGC